ncbi:YfiR family protein [Roseateles asaccharophilus]|uniref:YfiR family protein n=1 Tax=Roseateles asaccharophilus TaxID=582607 RepID=A0ABU2AA59_9BURK|nr:YfiR family protein [Roseateles asaccharophilus]MDR7332913.1 hypothetical protein [Roseateles asaccharophilus]
MTMLLRRSVLLALALGCAAARAAGDDDGNVEYQVKAAFVCKFGNYIDWPPHALGNGGEPFRIGVLASIGVVEEFRRTAAASSVGGRPVDVKRLSRGESLDGLHVVFVSRGMSAHTADVIAASQGRPVLTVTELDPGGATGMINFVVIDDKVRFDVLLAPAVQSGLKISVRLLGVARRVEGRS